MKGQGLRRKRADAKLLSGSGLTQSLTELHSDGEAWREASKLTNPKPREIKARPAMFSRVTASPSATVERIAPASGTPRLPMEEAIAGSPRLTETQAHNPKAVAIGPL